MSSQHSNTYDVATGHFSSLLRHWRNVRRLTQIELAGDANVSARHLCFLETGRAQPSREMVQLLGSALDLPLEERNALHVAAGFVPPYGDRGLAADNLQHVRQAFGFILRQQEPYPGNPAALSQVMTMQLAKGDFRLAFFSTFTTLAMPADAALQKLKIECFYPADSATAEKARELAL